MTRQPEIKNKSNRLVYVPVDQSEVKLAMDAKALCIQDGITIRDLLSEALELVFKVHHWPPGNPQLQLASFQEKIVVEKCKCGRPTNVWALHLASKEEHKFCSKCFSEIPMRYDSKVWHIIRRKS